MRRPRLWFAAITVALLGAILAWQLRRNDDDSASPSKTPSRDSKLPNLGSNKPPTRPDPATPGPAQSSSELLAIRSRGLATFRTELTRRMTECAPPSATTPPKPRAVQFSFEWAPEGSTLDQQQLIVRGVNVMDASLSPASRQCVEKTLGMSFTLFIPPDQLPNDSRRFAEVVHVPLP